MARLAGVLLACAALPTTGRAARQVESASQARAPWRFALLGHPRGGPQNGVFPSARLDEAIAEINRAQVDFTVLLGDIVWGDFENEAGPQRAAVAADWERVQEIWSHLDAPWYAVPGNHDVWDPTTRDLWVERFGALDRAFDHKGARFLLLNSCWTPTGDSGRVPGAYIRGAPLPPERSAWLREQLEASPLPELAVVLMHHLLWWDEDAPWWRDVHPLLAQHAVGLVACGDLGPLKFAHLLRDGVDYVQTAVEFNDAPLVMQRNREETRTLRQQPDTWLLVEVDGARLRPELRTLGAFCVDRFTPQAWRDVHEYDAGSLQRKVYRRMNTPERVLRGLAWAAAGALAAGLVLGLATGWWAGRRGRGASAR